MPLLVVLGIAAWFWLGDPPKTVAEWFWPEGAAPWEKVDAFYYPSRADLTVFQERRGLGSLDECRRAVQAMSFANNDVGMVKGDYECGVGPGEAFYGMTVYRITAK